MPRYETEITRGGNARHVRSEDKETRKQRIAREHANAILHPTVADVARIAALTHDRRLLGMPELGSSDQPLRGARIRNHDRAAPLPNPTKTADGAEQLVLTEWGILVFAKRMLGGGISMRAAQDTELKPSDLESVDEYLETFIPKHVERANKERRHYGRMVEVADKVVANVKARISKRDPRPGKGQKVD